MTKLVVDASVAVKWVIAETGTPEAVRLLMAGRLISGSMAGDDVAIGSRELFFWLKINPRYPHIAY